MKIVKEFETFPIRNKELFLRYAIPCGEVLVKRGDLRQEMLDKLDRSVREGREIDFPIENVFKVASRMCTILAKEEGKKEIDDDVIRRYFLFEHEKAIKWRSMFYPDVKLRDCLVYPARVMDARDMIRLSTPIGQKLVANTFENELRRRDWVSLHYDHISEKLDETTAKKMMKRIV
jgi:hypothetical protein